MSNINPIDIITRIRESDPYIEMIYLQGGCYKFHEILKGIFLEAEPYINEEKNHVVTKIDGNYYDITGHVKGEYQSLESEKDIKLCKSWSFSKNYFLTKECTYCEEPFLISAELQERECYSDENQNI